MTRKPATKKKHWLRLLKRIIVGVLFLLLFVVTCSIIFLGSIAEYMIEKNDVKYTGREIELSDLKVKIFSGIVHLEDLRFKEANGVDDFITIEGIYADIKPLDLLSKRLTLEEVGINRMICNISHTYRVFNFDDLVMKFYAQDSSNISADTVSTDWEWNIANIHVDSCRFNYLNHVLESRITVDPLNLSIPLISSSNDTLSAATDLAFLNGGKIGSSLRADLFSGEYELHINWDRVPMDYLLKYLNDYLHVSDFGGDLSLDLHSKGSLTNLSDVAVTGTIDADSLHVVDLEGDTVLAIGGFGIEIQEADYARDIYRFGTIYLEAPYVRFEIYPEGDNLSSLLKFTVAADSSESMDAQDISLPGREYFNVFIYLADYASYLVDQYTDSDYKIETISLTNGSILYQDHTLNQQATFLLENINLYADAFDSEQKRVKFGLESDINKVGHFEADWSFDPKDVLEMELQMTTQGFLVAFINPYSFFHTAHAFIDGNATYDGLVEIHDRQITSENRVFIENIEVGKKGFADPPVKLPVRLAVAILRDVNGNIELEVPVKGDLEDPKFSYWPVVWQVLVNNLEKLITAPFRLFANMFSVDQEDLEKVQWTYGQQSLEKSQQKSIQSLAKVLNGKPELALTYTPVNNRERESEYLALFATKRRYYCEQVSGSPDCALTSRDTLDIAKITNQDSAYDLFLQSHIPGIDTLPLLSVPEMAMRVAGRATIDSAVYFRVAQRDSVFRNALYLDHGIQKGRLVQIPFDSLEVPPDTFNLIGPMFQLGFNLFDSEIQTDSTTAETDRQN